VRCKVSNLLAKASTLIPLKKYQYLKFNSNIVNDVGIVSPAYDVAITIKANIQPVSRSVYEQFGLDMQKTYYTIFTSEVLQDLQRDKTGDKIIFNGKTLQIESNKGDWDSQYGFNSYLGVQID